MATWITADWHLGEDRWALMQRYGFTDAQDMVDQFAKMHNELVAPDDELLFVGDAVNQNAKQFLPQVARFNGRKTLFRGNHDRVFSDADLAPFFDLIVPEREGHDIEVGEDKIPCWVTHYPSEAKQDRFNLVGHIHGAWKVQLNAFNVGVDVNCFRPHNLDRIPFFFGAICNVYDADVWIAYQDHQRLYHASRGKKGRYLDVDGPVGGKG